MNKYKKVFIPIFFLCISVSFLAVAFVKLDVFDGFDLKSLFSKTSAGVVYVENTYMLNELKASYLKSVKDYDYSEKDNIYSVIYDLNKDISESEDVNAVIRDVYDDFNYLKNFIPEIIFVVPSEDERYEGLHDSSGNEFDLFSYVKTCAQDIGAEIVLIANDSLIHNDSGELTDVMLTEYVLDYSIDSVLYSPDKGYFSQRYYDEISFLNSALDEIDSAISLGAEIHTYYDNSFIDEFTERVLADKLIDFAFVDINRAVASEDYSFSDVASFWNFVLQQYSIPAYCEHRLDLVFTNDTDWGYGTEINKQIEALYSFSSFDVSCFNSLSSLRKKEMLARDLSIYVNDVSSQFQKNMRVNSLQINNQSVVFNGAAAEEAQVFCNDNSISNKNGNFSYSSDLSLGYNAFDFFCNGASYSYPVINVGRLFYSKADVASAYEPSKKIINAYAVCPVGSVVYAVFNGNAYQMQTVTGYNTPEGYFAYTVAIDLANTDISFAELSLFCGYQHLTETVSCGTFTDKNFSVINEEAVVDNYSLDPFSDNSLGNSLMCIINADNTEIISDTDDYDTYHPYNSSLLKGTVDYIKRINVSPEGYLRYELNSGLNVYGNDCILINNGYNLPSNNAVLKSFNDSSNGVTEFTISTDWLIPVTVTQQDLEYEKGYLDFNFNIKEYNAEYIDVNFYYTSSLAIESSVVFSDNSVFSHYEVKTDTAKGITVLRLYLRNTGEFFGFDILENDDGDIVLSFKNRTTDSVAGKVIMIDAGHGGLSMVGTALSDDSVSEAEVTLAIAKKVKKYLEDRGATVIMTREYDTSLTLSERTYLCETMNPDIFISIHCDGSESSYESGTHTFYFTPYSQPLADSIHNSLVKAYTEQIYTELDSNFSRVDRKIKYYPFYVTRVDNCPSVLIETGFMTNHTEGYVLVNPAHQDSIAIGIADGVTDYFNNN